MGVSYPNPPRPPHVLRCEVGVYGTCLRQVLFGRPWDLCGRRWGDRIPLDLQCLSVSCWGIKPFLSLCLHWFGCHLHHLQSIKSSVCPFLKWQFIYRCQQLLQQVQRQTLSTESIHQLEKNHSENDSKNIIPLCHYSCGVDSTILLYLGQLF